MIIYHVWKLIIWIPSRQTTSPQLAHKHTRRGHTGGQLVDCKKLIHLPRNICCHQTSEYILRPGAHFTNDFSIVILIRWQFRFTLPNSKEVIAKIFVHDMTAILSWHVQLWGKQPRQLRLCLLRQLRTKPTIALCSVWVSSTWGYSHRVFVAIRGQEMNSWQNEFSIEF